MSPFEQLAAALREEGGLLAAALAPTPASDPLIDRAVAGARAATAPEHYGIALAAVREGYLLHYGEGLSVRPEDPDLALLGGDRLYALALARLAELGDLDAVARLAELISRCAQAHAEDAPELAHAAWREAAAAIGHGEEAGA